MSAFKQDCRDCKHIMSGYKAPGWPSAILCRELDGYTAPIKISECPVADENADKWREDDE